MDFFFTASSSTTTCSGLKAQTWSPWSPHHQSLINRTKSTTTINNKSLSNLSCSNSNNNNWTTIQPTRRASMTSSRSAEENCASRLARKPFKRTNTFDTGLLSMATKTITPKSGTNNSGDADSRSSSASSSSSSTSSVGKAGSLENVSTRSNPF